MYTQIWIGINKWMNKIILLSRALLMNLDFEIGKFIHGSEIPLLLFQQLKNYDQRECCLVITICGWFFNLPKPNPTIFSIP